MNNNLKSLYLILGICAVALIVTGLSLPVVLNFFSVNMTKNVVFIFQSAFIISGFLDIWLIFYAKKKLS